MGGATALILIAFVFNALYFFGIIQHLRVALDGGDVVMVAVAMADGHDIGRLFNITVAVALVGHVRVGDNPGAGIGRDEKGGSGPAI